MKNGVNLVNRFLPQEQPLETLPAPFQAWENIAKGLAKFLLYDQFQKMILQLPPFPSSLLENEQQDERAMQILSYLGHAYVWINKNTPQRLPAILAQPWVELANKVGRLPVLSYASYALHNWKKLDHARPIELGNIALIQNFLSGVDEEWFILVHVDIEAKAIPIVQSCIAAIAAVAENNSEVLHSELHIIATALEKICATLDRMPEHCDPYIYYHRVRPYIHGWKNHPALPNGLIYDGVSQYQQQPQQFRGETGAQSSIIPTLDGLFGITHANDQLGAYLLEMRNYMPPAHRQLLEYVEQHSQIREFVKKNHATMPSLRELYNHNVQLIERFRQTHLSYAASYIQKQHQLSAGNPNAVGTGGTPFMQYLKKHHDETTTFLL
jgi:indoleamine 2,3-dioxygenase